MATLRIYDLNEGFLAVDLRDLLHLFAPHSLKANWSISSVKIAEWNDELFDATGNGGEELELLSKSGAVVSGQIMADLAKKMVQIIWGEFAGVLSETSGNVWVTIRAIDSTYYEISTLDEVVIEKVRSTFNDVRLVD